MSSYATCMDCQEQVVLEIILTVYCSYMQVLAGRHRCLWCQIASGALKTPRAQRGRNTPRTLQGIQQDYQRILKMPRITTMPLVPISLTLTWTMLLDNVCKRKPLEIPNE